METIAEIRKEFLARRAELDMLDQLLAEEKKVLQFSAFQAGRAANEEEKRRRSEIGSTRQEIADALVTLSLATIKQIEQSGELAILRGELADINSTLKDDLESLKQKAEYAEIAAKVMAGLALTTAKVAELAT